MLAFITLSLSCLFLGPVVPRYTIADLGPLPMIGNDALPGLSPQGFVVGWQNIGDTFHATFWQNTKARDLGSVTHYEQTFATAINGDATVVGIARSATDRRFTQAFSWQKGRFQDLGTLGGKYAKAFAINNDGQVVGSSERTDGAIHATQWSLKTNHKVINDLGVLGTGAFSEAHGINTTGHIVGASEATPNGKKQAFLWKPEKGMHALGLLPGGSLSDAQAINNQGVVVGWADTEGSELHAFAWQEGKMTDLGTLGDEPCVAFGVNTSGQVVGTSATDLQQMHAFLWYNGSMQDLNHLLPPGSGWTLREAYRINDRGQIIGKGMRKGQAHLFLLTPVP